MRLVNIMILVSALILLATVPACLHAAQLWGFNPPVALGSVVALLIFAGLLGPRT